MPVSQTKIRLRSDAGYSEGSRVRIPHATHGSDKKPKKVLSSAFFCRVVIERNPAKQENIPNNLPRVDDCIIV